MLIPWWLIITVLITVPLTVIAIKLQGRSEKSNRSDEADANEKPLNSKDALVVFGFALLLILSPLILTDSFIHFVEWLEFDAIRDLGEAIFGIQPKQPRMPPGGSPILF